MQVTRRSPYTGKINTMEIDCTQEQLDEYAQPRQTRRMVQEIFPNLSQEHREFIMTGYTPEDWEAIFPKEDDDEDQ